MKSRERADRIIKLFDKNFRHRWERYNDMLLKCLGPDVKWVDCGCGENAFVREHGHLAGSAIGIDLLEPRDKSVPFIKTSITQMPFETESVDLASFRFVIEHLPDPEADLKELQRVLRPGGRAIVITTNIINPAIAFARLFPYKLKHRIITGLFKVDDEDVFPTYHMMNTPAAVKKGVGALKPVYIEYISDLNSTNTIIFWLYLIWHVLTRPSFMNRFRSNILCIFEKQGE